MSENLEHKLTQDELDRWNEYFLKKLSVKDSLQVLVDDIILNEYFSRITITEKRITKE